MAASTASVPRATSRTGSARLSLSVGRSNPPASGNAAGRHPLKQEWSLSYVHRPPGAKVEYEKEIRRVATFGSIESFLHLYSHLTPPNELPPVTDLLVFLGRIGRPGVWEEMRDGGKFTLRLQHPITPLLFETLLFSLLGDQFDDADGVVGCVLSVRQAEDILSVWVEEEGDSVRSGALREKILSLLGLPSTTLCEYRSNRALLDAASKPYPLLPNHEAQHDGERSQVHSHHQAHGHPHQHPRHHLPHQPHREHREPREHRDGREPREGREHREPRERAEGGYVPRRENGWGPRRE